MFGSSLFGGSAFGDIKSFEFTPLEYWTEACLGGASWVNPPPPEDMFTTVTFNSIDWQNIPADQVTIKRC